MAKYDLLSIVGNSLTVDLAIPYSRPSLVERSVTPQAVTSTSADHRSFSPASLAAKSMHPQIDHLVSEESVVDNTALSVITEGVQPPSSKEFRVLLTGFGVLSHRL